MFGIPTNWLIGAAILLLGLPAAYKSPQIAALLTAIWSKAKGDAPEAKDAEWVMLPDGYEAMELDEDALDAEAAKRLQARYSKRGKPAREAMQVALQHHFDPVELPPEVPVDPQFAAQVHQVLAARPAQE